MFNEKLKRYTFTLIITDNKDREGTGVCRAMGEITVNAKDEDEAREFAYNEIAHNSSMELIEEEDISINLDKENMGRCKKDETIKECKERILKPYNATIQVCPVCSKVDVSLNDGHNCQQHIYNQNSLYYKD